MTLYELTLTVIELCAPRGRTGDMGDGAMPFVLLALGLGVAMAAEETAPGQKACLPGTELYGENDGVPMCKGCDPGKFSIGGLVKDKPACKPCMAGHFSPGHSNKQCWPCPEGKYMSHNGAPLCWDCPAGSHQPKTGHYSCYHCAVGQYQAKKGQVLCLKCDTCAKGRYGTTRSKTTESETACTCEDCPEGKYTAEGHTQCYDCPNGRFQMDKGKAFCYYCQAGSYSVPGQKGCTACEFEKFQNATGKGSCEKCPFGMYQHMRGQTSCRDTPAHKAQLDLHKAIDHNEL